MEEIIAVNNRVLDINLSTGKIGEIEISHKDRREYIGGKGLATRLLFEHIKTGIDPLSPDNIIVKDGYCIIGITRAGQTGYNGTVPKDESTSITNPKTGSALPTTPLRIANLHKPLIISLNGRSLSDASRRNHDIVSPGLWIIKENAAAFRTDFLLSK